MTSNQIKFWELRERERSNRANETETARSNRAREALTSFSNTEQLRHNMQTESQAASDLLERSRSNRVNEDLQRQQVSNALLTLHENVRHNQAQEVIGRSQATGTLLRGRASVTSAQNAAVDAITRQRAQAEDARHNQAQEAIGWASTAAKTGTDILGTLGNLVGRVIGRGGLTK